MDIENARKEYSWLADYYGVLKGSVIQDVSLSIDEETKLIYPTFKVFTFGNKTYECEIVCQEDINMPGFVTGLPF
jgi:hypothetical protein